MSGRLAKTRKNERHGGPKPATVTAPSDERRARRSAARREQILIGARRLLLDRHDFLGVTMDEVARAADVSKGTIYNFFDSREDLYAALAAEVSRAVLTQLEALALPRPPRAAIPLVVRTYVFEYARRSEYRFLADYCQRPRFRDALGTKMREELGALDAGYRAFFAPLLAKVCSTLGTSETLRLFRIYDAGLVGGLRAVWNGRVAPDELEQFAEDLGEFFVRGLPKGGSRRPSARRGS